MDKLIDRYIYDVVRRLPEKEREEVSRELRANIEDMLPDAPAEADVEAVLLQLGAPAKLAEQYRQKPMYLISPALYSDYVNALKWAVPLVGVVLLCVGVVLSVVQLADGQAPVGAFASIFGTALSMGLQGAFQALVWVTVGFAIAERAGYRTDRPWQISDLPPEVPAGKKRIPLSDSIVELAFGLVFTALAALYCLGAFPQFAVLRTAGVQIDLVSSPEVLRSLVLPVILVGALGAAECVVKMIYRVWNPAVCVAVVLSNLLSGALSVYILSRTNLFGLSVTFEMSGVGEWLLAGGIGLIICCAIALGVAIECIGAVYKTFFVKTVPV